jgi:hypothetical protein
MPPPSILEDRRNENVLLCTTFAAEGSKSSLSRFVMDKGKEKEGAGNA